MSRPTGIGGWVGDRPPVPVVQIGSITKVWTATLARQLVDEAPLDLDAFTDGQRRARTGTTSTWAGRTVDSPDRAPS